MPNVAQLASRLSTRGWLVAGGVTVVTVVVLYMLLHLVSQPSYTTLVTGIEPAQTGKMTSALSQKGISYELQNNGTALAVQSNQTAQARIALASSGLLENAQQPGFSLFNKTNLGESSFQQQVTYQRALQGQLAQTIDQIQGISGAQVELVLPSAQSQLFAESQTPPSAAVLLSGSGSPEAATVRGIAHLVASSVPGLKTSNVTITGASGELLWPGQGSGEGGESASKQGAQQRYDQQMASSIEAMLGQTVGAGKAQVQVYANLNVNQTTQEQLTYGKGGTPLQQNKDLETLAGSGGSAGAAGTAAIPNYARGASGNSNYKHEVTQTTMGVNKTVTHSTIAPGEVTNQHISVLLDKSVPASAVPAIREAVSNAAGVEPKRGDSISIAQMAFSKAPTTTATSASSILSYAKDALFAIAALAFLFFTTRFLRKREKATIDHEPVWLRELEAPMPLAELEREAGATPALAAASNGNGNGSGNGHLARKQVEELAASNPDQIAQQVRAWMRES
jgi:flagellar M-ring protein FliF